MRFDLKIDLLEQKDKKIFFIGIITAMLFEVFWDKAYDIIIMMGVVYFFNKYINKITISLLSDENIEYTEIKLYCKKIKQFLIAVNIYIIIRFVMIVIFNIGRYNSLEIILLTTILMIYAEYLGYKYVKTINGEKYDKEIVFANNKVLSLIIVSILIGFSINYSNKIIKSEDHIKLNNYEYKLSYDEEKNRIIDISGDGFYQQVIENKSNKLKIDEYVKNCKALLNVKIIENYSMIAMIFMFIIIGCEILFMKVNKNKISVILYSSLLLSIIFGINAFSTYSIDIENRIFTTYVDEKLYIE